MKIKDPKGLTIRLGKVFFPIVLGLGVYWLWNFFTNEISKIWPLLVAYFFPPFGKETVIPLGVGVLKQGLTVPVLNLSLEPVSINPLSMALAVAFIDIVVALFLVWNYDLAKRIPFVGKFMIRVERIGRSTSDKYGWVKPLRFMGIVLFVMVPFQGSGGLVGSIVGRLVGMKPWSTFLAISFGAVTGCLMVAYLTEAFLSVLVKNFLLGVLVIIVVLVVIIMVFIYRSSKKKQG
jgi:uncharacterized membrane protein